MMAGGGGGGKYKPNKLGGKDSWGWGTHQAGTWRSRQGHPKSQQFKKPNKSPLSKPSQGITLGTKERIEILRLPAGNH